MKFLMNIDIKYCNNRHVRDFSIIDSTERRLQMGTLLRTVSKNLWQGKERDFY